MDERDRRRVRARCSPDDVHGLDVAVDDAPLVEVRDAAGDLPEDVQRLRVAQRLVALRPRLGTAPSVVLTLCTVKTCDCLLDTA